MKKIINLLLLISILLIIPSNAQSIRKMISESSIDNSAIVATEVFDTQDSKVLYKHNETKMLNPASILKVFTFGCAYKILGENYKFETSIYKNQNNLYIKLGGDTLFSFNDLVQLIASAKKQVNFDKIENIYIDDTIFDKEPYHSSWMQNDMWPYQRLITPYIIDRNLTDISIKRSSLSTKVDIIQGSDYKMPIINKLTLFDENANNNITISKANIPNTQIIEFDGDLSSDIQFKTPVSNPELNFKIRLKKAIEKNEIAFDKNITAKKVPMDSKKITTISHSIKDISSPILISSDNIDAETVFKVAAAKYINYKKPATFKDGYNMMYATFDYLTEDNFKLYDASGVSRYNLLNADIACKLFSDILNLKGYRKLLASPNQGTLSNRFLFMQDNLKAKTGTLKGSSSILASFTSYDKKELIVCNIIQNSTAANAILKDFENRLISLIYRKY